MHLISLKTTFNFLGLPDFFCWIYEFICGLSLIKGKLGRMCELWISGSFAKSFCGNGLRERWASIAFILFIFFLLLFLLLVPSLAILRWDTLFCSIFLSLLSFLILLILFLPWCTLRFLCCTIWLSMRWRGTQRRLGDNVLGYSVAVACCCLKLRV